MPTPTYTLIDSEVLASAASSVEFTSISGDYRDLILVVNGKTISGTADGILEFNNDTTITNYKAVRMQGNGSTATSSAASQYIVLGNNVFNATDAGLVKVQIMDYSTTNKHTTVLTRAGRGGGANTPTVIAAAGRWENTSAVSSLKVTCFGNSFAAGTTFYLYGIEA